MSYQYAARRAAAQKPFRLQEPGAVQDPLLGGVNHSMPSARRVDLPGALQSKMEASFGADFSNIKLYESPAVDEAGDLAVTQGSNIAFAPGALNLSSRTGQELLGHELSHVVSQARGEARGTGLLENASLEAKADREGALAAAGMSVGESAAGLDLGGAGASAAAPMQAKRKKGRRSAARRRAASKRAAQPPAQAEEPAEAPPPAKTESAAATPAPALIKAVGGDDGTAAPAPAEKAAEAAAPEAAAAEAAAPEELPMTRGGKIGSIVGKGMGILGKVAGTAGGILDSLGLGVASKIVGGIGKGLGDYGSNIGSFVGSLVDMFGRKKGAAEAEGEAGADQAALAEQLSENPEAAELLEEEAKKKA